jgi:hypothetical protein
MAYAIELGNKVALMNASVTITDNATISDTDIQTFINRIKTMNGQFTYSSGSATGYAATFNEMVAATDMDVTMAGPISATKLTSASTVTITTSYSTKITSVDLGALTSVTSIDSGADAAEVGNTLTVSSATNVDLGALTRYGAALSITTKKDATLDIASLDDKTTAGLQSDITLTLNGPASVNLSLIADGIIDLTNVATATVSGFYGELDINGGVETLTTTDSVRIDLDGATDLVTATLDFKYDWDPSLTTAQAAVADDLSNQGYLEDYTDSNDIGGTDLKTLTISGELLDLYLDEANLETLTLTGVTMHGLTISGATDLTTLSVAAGNKIGDIDLTGATNLTVADFNHTTNLDGIVAGTTAGTSTSVETGVRFVATDNTALTKLHTTGDHVDTFTVTGNDALTELDMTGLDDFGTTVEPAFNLWDNDLTAVTGSDTWDGETATTTTGADGGTADAGSWDDGTSGMDTMKPYLAALAAEADADGYAGFDTVSTFNNTDASETATVSTSLSVTGPTTTPSSTNDSTVLYMVEATANDAAGAKDATTAQRAFNVTTAAGTIRFTVNGAQVPATSYTLVGNPAVDALNIASTANVNLASAAGIILDAKVGGHSTAKVSLVDYPAGSTATADERYTSATVSTAATTTGNIFTTGREDEFTLNVGSNSVTASLSGQAVAGTALADIEEAIVKAWAAKYGSAGTASLSAIATMADDGDGILEITMLQKDSGGFGKAISMSVSNKTTTTNAQSTRESGNIGYVVGATSDSGDNTSDGASTIKDLIITFKSKNDGTLNNSIMTGVAQTAVDGKATLVEFTTNYTANTAWAGSTTTYAGVLQPRTDVIGAEAAAAAATSTAVAQTLFNRATWLG